MPMLFIKKLIKIGEHKPPNGTPISRREFKRLISRQLCDDYLKSISSESFQTKKAHVLKYWEGVSNVV